MAAQHVEQLGRVVVTCVAMPGHSSFFTLQPTPEFRDVVSCSKRGGRRELKRTHTHTRESQEQSLSLTHKVHVPSSFEGTFEVPHVQRPTAAHHRGKSAHQSLQ